MALSTIWIAPIALVDLPAGRSVFVLPIAVVFHGRGIRAASALNDLLENQPVARSVDIDRIRGLTRAGKKIEAIRNGARQTV
jgi:hypothetical protein